MRQKLRKFQEVLGIFYLPLLLFLTFIALLVIGYGNVKPTTYTVELNQVAKETIRAPRTLEDKAQTEKNQQIAMDAVSDVLVFDQERMTKQLTNIQQFFQAIKSVASKASAEIIKTDQSNSSEESVTRVATTQERVQYFKKSLEKENQSIREFAIFIPDKYISQLLQANNEQLASYEKTLKSVVETQMKNAISESNVTKAQEEAKKTLFYSDYSDTERDLLGQLVTVSVVVNNVVDKEATQKAKEAAKAAVTPVKILQGQVLIQEGHVISNQEIHLIELFGLSNGQRNYHELFSYLIFLTGIIIFLAVYFYNPTQTDKQNPSDTASALTVFSLVFVAGVFILKILALVQHRGVEHIGLVFPIAGFIYLLYRLTKSLRLTIFSIVLMPIFSWYFFSQSTNSLHLILTTVFLSMIAWIGILNEKMWSTQAWIKRFMKYLLYPVLLGVPFVLYSNYEFQTQQTMLVFLFLLLSGFLSFILPVILMPYLSYVFEDSSVLLWAELSNPNQPLLKDLITKAPGTYHHSLMVANISANCVEAIGGDSQLARVACYYHDIGKLEHPFFFIENLPGHMESPHNMISAEESAQIIFNHVTKGVEILTQHQLPQAVIDICAQHHGTTLMKYFYAEALKNNPDVKEEDFRYPGPKPQTKEAAIINIVDSAEAATRAMKEPTLEKVEALVHSIIVNRLEDEQFVECDITMKEIAIVEKMIATSLNGTFHSRIEYPTIKKQVSK
ncbi:HDIG domain-containing metalloprotein [uncultured Granulicatella sp.]|uniref:HD family phosphohydrolase n=1 Tax=uncultured Granulicatella sp. TaxID=316089 RepID=UPI0028D475BF|nr:HDIG domain-containing metalloprotein [uncultured Granulicatella sp.]